MRKLFFIKRKMHFLINVIFDILYFIFGFLLGVIFNG